MKVWTLNGKEMPPLPPEDGKAYNFNLDSWQWQELPLRTGAATMPQESKPAPRYYRQRTWARWSRSIWWWLRHEEIPYPTSKSFNKPPWER